MFSKEDLKLALTFIIAGLILVSAQFFRGAAVIMVLLCLLAHREIRKWFVNLY